MNSKTKGFILIFLTAIISGLAIFLSKEYLNTGIDPITLTGIKSVYTAIFFTIIILSLGMFQEFKRYSREQRAKLALVGIFGGCIPFILFFEGLAQVSALSAAFLHKTMFLFVFVSSYFFLGENINKRMILAGALLFIGNIMLLGLDASVFSVGGLYILLAVICWTGENTISKSLLADISPLTVIWSRMTIGSAGILVFWLARGEISVFWSLGSDQLDKIMLSSFFLCGYVFTWYFGLKHIQLSKASLILCFSVPITALLSLSFSKIPLSSGILYGIVFSFFALYVILRDLFPGTLKPLKSPENGLVHR